jgi:hypothetical protein
MDNGKLVPDQVVTDVCGLFVIYTLYLACKFLGTI